ncbi:MAG: hypothetical protein J6K75_05480 [Erysipelotrichaceae bacterium]|nr:hypothetical protein [Erysipelotrichaceae bacterium]
MLSFISTVLLIRVFVEVTGNLFIEIGVYVLSFYSLVIFCTACYKKIPKCFMRIKSKAYENQHIRKYFTDRETRMKVNTVQSLLINGVYSALNLMYAYQYQTAWFMIFSVYYGVLAFLRFLLIRYVENLTSKYDVLKELKICRLCSWGLISINFLMFGAVLMMVYFGRGFTYSGILIYAMALYTFYMFSVAMIDMIRYRNQDHPFLSVASAVRLSAALVSMLCLETAMFSQFGEETSIAFQKIMIISTGIGIAAIVFMIAIYLVVSTTKKIHCIKEDK